jgi:hypothetical protein
MFYFGLSTAKVWADSRSRFLLENHYVVPVVGYDSSLMEIFSRDILSRIRAGKSGWEKMVPEKATSIIKERHLFSYKTRNVAVQAL